MPFVYSAAESLRDHAKVGSTACAALVQRYTIVGPTSEWVAGERVVSNLRICAGTAIATFRHGRYSGADHAAFFLRHGPGGSIVVIDQGRDHPDLPMRPIGIRTIEHGVADAYFVIERRLTLPAPPPSMQRTRTAAY